MNHLSARSGSEFCRPQRGYRDSVSAASDSSFKDAGAVGARPGEARSRCEWMREGDGEQFSTEHSSDAVRLLHDHPRTIRLIQIFTGCDVLASPMCPVSQTSPSRTQRFLARSDLDAQRRARVRVRGEADCSAATHIRRPLIHS